MLTDLERRWVRLGAIFLLIHIAITVGTVVEWAAQTNIHALHLLSATMYLLGYVTIARAFFRSAPVSCVLFGLVLAAGIIDAVFIATLTSRHIFGSFSEALIPVAFLIFGTILLRSQGVLRVIGIGYLCGGLSWFLASIGIFGTVATTNAGFIAEFLGMNATIALIVWAFYPARKAERVSAESAVASAAV